MTDQRGDLGGAYLTWTSTPFGSPAGLGTIKFRKPWDAIKRPDFVVVRTRLGGRSASACATLIVPHSTHSPSVMPTIWLAVTALIMLASCGIAGRRAPSPRMLRLDARPRSVRDVCGCSRHDTAPT